MQTHRFLFGCHNSATNKKCKINIYLPYCHNISYSLFGFFLFLRLLQTVSNREVEVHTEDEQTFLARQQQLLMNGQPPSSGRGDDQSFLNRQQQMLMDGHSAGNRSESPMRTQTIGSIKSSPRAQVCVRASTIFCFAFKLKSVNNHK